MSKPLIGWPFGLECGILFWYVLCCFACVNMNVVLCVGGFLRAGDENDEMELHSSCDNNFFWTKLTSGGSSHCTQPAYITYTWKKPLPVLPPTKQRVAD